MGIILADWYLDALVYGKK